MSKRKATKSNYENIFEADLNSLLTKDENTAINNAVNMSVIPQLINSIPELKAYLITVINNILTSDYNDQIEQLIQIITPKILIDWVILLLAELSQPRTTENIENNRAVIIANILQSINKTPLTFLQISKILNDTCNRSVQTFFMTNRTLTGDTNINTNNLARIRDANPDSKMNQITINTTPPLEKFSRTNAKALLDPIEYENMVMNSASTNSNTTQKMDVVKKQKPSPESELRTLTDAVGNMGLNTKLTSAEQTQQLYNEFNALNPVNKRSKLGGGNYNKKKTNKRKTNKRKTNKRKTNKRKTNKRKTNNKRNPNKSSKK